MAQYKTGVVLGKFMPPHKGHEYMIRFAQQYAQKLYVIVDCLEGQTIDPQLRASWIRQEIPGVEVIALSVNTPQDPSEHHDFWNVWRSTIYDALPEKPDVLIAAMEYGWPLSKALDCDFVPVDIARESFPISATEIRANVYEKWDFLMDSAKPHFMKKYCFTGPESTGKSTCAMNVASHYSTIYVPEYAKSVINTQNGEFFLHNVNQVATAQMRSEIALSKFSNRLLVCDTDPLTTLVWSHTLFGVEPPELLEMVKNIHYDNTFVFAPDVPWVADVHRQVLPDAANDGVRQAFFDKTISYLQRFGRAYTIVSGSFEQRFETVTQYIDHDIGHNMKATIRKKV